MGDAEAYFRATERGGIGADLDRAAVQLGNDRNQREAKARAVRASGEEWIEANF